MKESILKDQLVRFPIGVKLAIIIGLVVLLSLGTVTGVTNYFMSRDVSVTAQNTNFSVNSRSSDTVNDKIQGIRSNAFQILDLINFSDSNSSNNFNNVASSLYFERNPDVVSVIVLGEDGKKSVKLVNDSFLVKKGLEDSLLEDYLVSIKPDVALACYDEIIALNSSVYFDEPLMTLLYPWKNNGKRECCLIIFSIESLSEIIGTTSEHTTFLVNDRGDLLCHPDIQRVLYGESFVNYPLFVQIQNDLNSGDGKFSFISKQIQFEDKSLKRNENKFYGSYELISGANIYVMTTVPINVVLEAVRLTMRNNILITVIVFFLSVIIILTFARYAISLHLRKLTNAAKEIQQGNFDSALFESLKSNRNDEIGVLNQSTKDESEFLITFGKFTNKNVAKAIATKSINFEPHLKDITIFFSDIRGFTAISDGFNKKFGADSGAEIIGFLNDYMSRMVECVELSHGNIDKFEGDAIMAVWGILRDDDLSYEQMDKNDPVRKSLEEIHNANVLEDITNAITGTLAMRYALMKYNKDAEIFTKEHEGEKNAKYKPQVKIGCGINAGRASVGLMGSKDKMEYTSIGDPVNFASRTEASNKVCGTDILITEDVYNLLKDKFIRTTENGNVIPAENEEKEIIVEKIPAGFEVKGKGTQYFYAVVNMPKFDIESFFRQNDSSFVADPDCVKAVGKDGPKNLNEVRKMLGIKRPDFSKVNLNEEENKIQVKK